MSKTARIIKKETQAEIARASQDEHFASRPVVGLAVAPASEAPAGEGKEEGSQSHSKILRGRQVRPSVRPVLVEAEEFVPDLPLPKPLDGSEASQDGTEASGEAEPTLTSAEWKARLDEAVAEARAEGYEEGREAGYETGYAEAEAALRSEYEEEQEALTRDAARLDALWKEHIENSEPMLVELSLQLAQALVDAPLTESVRRTSEEALAEAVAELAGTPPLTVTVHPVDYLRLQESGLAERLDEMYEELHWEADPGSEEGDWSVSSPAGAVRRLRREIVETLRRRLGLSPEAAA